MGSVRVIGSAMAAAKILPLVDAAAAWPTRGALLGLDLGTKTIGVAVSDADRRVAAAVETIARTAFTRDAARLVALAGERNVVGIVLGLPLNMDGSEGPGARSARIFAEKVAEVLGVTVEMFDERLTSFEAEERLKGMPIRKGARKPAIDAIAAAVILEGWMESRKR